MVHASLAEGLAGCGREWASGGRARARLLRSLRELQPGLPGERPSRRESPPVHRAEQSLRRGRNDTHAQDTIPHIMSSLLVHKEKNRSRRPLLVTPCRRTHLHVEGVSQPLQPPPRAAVRGEELLVRENIPGCHGNHPGRPNLVAGARGWVGSRQRERWTDSSGALAWRRAGEAHGPCLPNAPERVSAGSTGPA